jgi:hypothetical protein
VTSALAFASLNFCREVTSNLTPFIPLSYNERGIRFLREAKPLSYYKLPLPLIR